MKKIHLGVVDQSPIRKGGTASQALSESVTSVSYTHLTLPTSPYV